MRIERPKRNETAVVTCTAEEKEEWYNIARESGRTFSGYVRWLLTQEKESQETKSDG